jgi:tRNA (guanine26-N2/guanine27-N2)-dimethyltransferase
MIGMLTVAGEEVDAPLFYDLRSIVKAMKCEMPSLAKFHSAILNAGYQVSISHCASNTVKTDAPPEVLWAILQAYRLEHLRSGQMVPAGNFVAQRLVELPPVEGLTVSFEKHPDADKPSRKIKLIRFEQHKGMNWGPKARAKSSKKKVRTEAEDEEQPNK